MRRLTINNNLAHKQANQRKKAEARTLRNDMRKENERLAAEQAKLDAAMSKRRAQITVARAVALKRTDELPSVPMQKQVYDIEGGRMTLDRFENKYGLGVQPIPEPIPSRWSVFKMKVSQGFMRVQASVVEKFSAASQSVSTGVNRVTDKLSQFFTFFKEKYDTWQAQKPVEKTVEDTVKMKNGYYDVPVIEDERNSSAYTSKLLAAHFAQKFEDSSSSVSKMLLHHPLYNPKRSWREPGQLVSQAPTLSFKK